MRKLLLVAILSLFISSLNGQVNFWDYYKDLNGWKKFSVKWDNDIAFQTDRYYTNGLEFEYHDQRLQHLYPSRFLFNPFETSESIYSLTLTHHIFTPKVFIIPPGTIDRPFSSYLLLGFKAMNLSSENRAAWTSELRVGLMGKYAGGELVQNSIHKMLPASEPVPGWNTQIDHDVCIDYQVKFEKEIFAMKYVAAEGLAKGTLGVPYTNFGAGLRLKAGLFPDAFSKLGFFDNTSWNIFTFIDACVLASVYDATLQGGAFNQKNHYTLQDINVFVGEMDFGISGKWKALSAGIGGSLRTPRFQEGLPHRWGYIEFGYIF